MIRCYSEEPLLKRHEEIELGRQVQAMVALPEGSLSPQQQTIQRVGLRARDRLIRANLRWVIAIAKTKVNLVETLDLEDLVDEDVFGLIRAIEKFAPSKGFKLSTYATWWIRQAMDRAIAMQGQTIRWPIHQVELRWKYRRFCQQYQQEQGCYPSEETIAAHLGKSVAWVRDFRAALRPLRSLDAPTQLGTGEAGDTVLDLLADPQAQARSKLFEDQEYLKGLFSRANLTPQEIEIFWANQVERESLQSIGECYGWSLTQSKSVVTKCRRRLRSAARRSAGGR
jgi:RNA polymerase sigma factor (sigma-70 family)